MDEADYWAGLEYRLCREFTGFEDVRLRHHWCDGLIAEEFDLRAEQPCVRGRAWCGPSGQEPWTFTLLLGRAVAVRQEIDWSALLPGEHLTGWLTPDPRRRSLWIDPGSAYDDQPERPPRPSARQTVAGRIRSGTTGSAWSID